MGTMKHWLSLTVLLAAASASTAAPPATRPTTAPAGQHPPIRVEGVPETITSPLGRTMTLRFDDEFDAVTDADGKPYVDRSKWQTTFWQGSSERTLLNNLEAQYYFDKDYAGRGEVAERIDPFSFETPGVLTISATKVPEKWWHNWWMGEQRPFASGILISDKAFTFQYGYVEGRFKLPGARGAWPAFWLLGNEPRDGDANAAHRWPPEVDVFEFFGHRPTKHTAGVIAEDQGPDDWHFGMNEPGVDLSQDFHVWGLEWNEREMAFTLDGKIWARAKTTPQMRRHMYLLVNLAVGGKWYGEEVTAAGTPTKPWEVDEGAMPWKMECDYVRVYQE